MPHYSSTACCYGFKYRNVLIFCSFFGWPFVTPPPALVNIGEHFWVQFLPWLPHFKEESDS